MALILSLAIKYRRHIDVVISVKCWKLDEMNARLITLKIRTVTLLTVYSMGRKKMKKSIWYAHAAYVILTSDVAAGVLSIIKSCAPVLPRNQWIRPGHLLLDWDKMPWSFPEGRRCCLWKLLSFVADSLILGIRWYISQIHSQVCVYKRGWGRSLCLHVVLFSIWKKRKDGWLLVVVWLSFFGSLWPFQYSPQW